MPKMTEAVQRSTGSLKQELSDRMAKNIDPGDHPFYNTIKAGPRVKQALVEVMVKGYPSVVPTPVPDGTPAGTATRTERAKIQSYIHYFRQHYGVTPMGNLSDNAGGVGRNELAVQREDALVLLERQKELQFTSTSTCGSDNGVVGYKSRGAFDWLKSTAQDVLPVPEAFRPASTNHYTGAWASYNQSAVETQLNSMFGEAKSRLNLDIFAAIDLKNKIDGFTIVHPDGSSTNQPRVQYVVQGVNELTSNVNLINISSALARVHLVVWINYDVTTGAAGTYTSKSGLFVNKDMWEIRALGGTTHLPLADDGSGPQGIFESWEGLFCLNPLGQGYTAPTS